MKTCTTTYWFKKHTNVIPPKSWVTVNSTKHTCRLSIVKNGRLILYTSVRRSPEYPGYERRLGIAAYVMGKNLGWHAQRVGLIEKTRLFFRRFKKVKKRSKGSNSKKLIKKKSQFILRVKGDQEYAVKGLIDGGFRFSQVIEVKNPAFNGCRKKKIRRR